MDSVARQQQEWFFDLQDLGHQQQLWTILHDRFHQTLFKIVCFECWYFFYFLIIINLLENRYIYFFPNETILPRTVSFGGKNDGLSVVVDWILLFVLDDELKSVCDVREGMSIKLSSLLPRTITPLLSLWVLTHFHGSSGSSFANP